MVYTHFNVSRRCQVVDIEGGPKVLHHVDAIDTHSAQVRVVDQPPRLDGAGEVATHIEQFRAIHPIFGGEPWPMAFHCYR